jgi:hypothetical protein
MVPIFFISSFFVSSLKAVENEFFHFDKFDRWYEVFIDQSKVGYAHSMMHRIGDKIISESTLKISIKRAGVPIEISSIDRIAETIDGKIIGFTGEMKMAGVPIVKEGRVDGTDIVVQHKQFQRTHTNRYKLDPNGLMTWGLLKLLREQGFKKRGKQIETKIYSADFGMDAPTPAKIKFFGKTSLKINGKDKQVFETKILLTTSKGVISTLNWIDENGFAVKTSMKFGGVPIQILETNMNQALKNPEYSEFLLNTLLPVNQEIPQNAKSVQFKIETINGSKIKNLYESGNQKVSRVSESSSLVEVRNVNFRESKSAYLNMREQKFIKPNTMIDSNDPVIQTLARNAARGSKNIYDVANKLSKFSYNFIKNKNFRVGFATATEVARNNEGDCTEHAVFLAALGRSMGIPSRVATGLVFMKNFKDQENVLGFHMWTEFFLKGRWCTFDSALNKTGAQTDRITLSTSSLSEDTINEIGLEIYEFLSNLNVKVQKIDFN